jgi:hypothetical protein
MDLQYISDTQGKHTAVIIPIEEWNNITEKHQDLKMLEKPEKKTIKAKPSDFIGTLSKEDGEKMQNDIEESRKEWERNF